MPVRDSVLRRGERLLLAAAAAATALLPACQSCKNDHPFVPFHIAEGGPASSGAVSPDAARPSASDAGPSAHQPALVAPVHAATWTLGTLALTAPAGAMFRQGLTWDVDGDGRDDALVLVEAGGDVVHEELLFYRATATGVAPPVQVSLPVVPVDSLNVQCARIEHLARVGARSAAVEIGESCPKGLTERGPDRLVALVAWADGWKTRLALPVVDPQGAAALLLDLDGADLDGDGLDDVTLRVSLEAGGEPPFEPGPAVHAIFRWFDRPAGMSREPGEPEKSLHAIAVQASQRASKPKEAAAAVGLATAGRFLFQSTCAESPHRRVAPAPATSPLTCEAGHALEELRLAATHAHVTLGDALRAIADFDSTDVSPATRTPPRPNEVTGWISAVAPVVSAASLRAISAVPRLGPETASWGALRFEPSGQLLVRTLAGVVRVDPVHGDEADATGVLAWPTNVVSPDGKQRLEGVFAPCASPTPTPVASLVAFEGASLDGGDAIAVPLPVLPSFSPRCAAATLRQPLPVLPVAWGPGGLELVVAGEPVLLAPGSWKASPTAQFLGQPVLPGSPRSPDGATFVVPTFEGLLVRGAKTRLFRAKELEHGYGELRDCTVSDDASRVACVRGGVAFVGIWGPPAGSGPGSGGAP